jgi:hypothetical protein
MNTEVTQQTEEEKRDFIREFYDKQQYINQQQEELYFITKQYYSEKYPKLKQGNYYAKEYYGTISFLYQSNSCWISRISKRYSIEERYGINDSVYDFSENLIEKHFRFDCSAIKIGTKGLIDRRYDSFYFKSEYEKYFLLFNDSNKDDVFKMYGIKNTTINRVNLLKLYNKMKSQSDLERAF